jgi:nucleotide-binding universal stress UspA family protein
MHVLIATTGVLSPGPAVEFTSHLIGDQGRVSVTTVIEVPRTFLEDLRSEEWHPLDAGEDRAGLLSGDEAIIARYVEERGKRITEPVVGALRAAGFDADVIFLEGEDAAAMISSLADEVDADVVVLGSTRRIFDQSAWESVSARVMAESGRPVLVLPPPQKDAALLAAENER